MDCAELREVAPDVALGLLTGEERAAALAHLQGCEACRAEVASLAGTADEVLLAAPEATPPPGFAPKVLARLAADAAGRQDGPAPAPGARPGGGVAGRSPVPSRGRRRRSAAALGAAAALLALAGVGGMVVAGHDPAPDAAETVVVAEMRTGSGRPVGEAAASGDPAQVHVAVPGWGGLVERWGDSTTYWLSVELEDGTQSMAAAPADRESWTVEVDGPADEVVMVSVLDSEGRVWCSGRFS